MAIVRFIGDDNNIHFGRELQPGTAAQLAGNIEEGFSETGQTLEVGKLLAPVVPPNIFAIGLNYRRHAEETGAKVHEHPTVFMKPTSAVTHHGASIVIPACNVRGPEVDFECELAVVIGKAARDVAPSRALDHVFGYTCGNDVSARRWQKHSGGGQWIRGKGFDTFCPLGPRLLLREELSDPQNLSISTTINGELMQQSNTADMIFSVADVISFLSQDTTLLPGTVILTGTPEGVGFVRNPPRFLEAGDEVTVKIEKIGELTNKVVNAAV